MKSMDTKIVAVQTVSDIITNSSSEVFITTYPQPLPRGESWSCPITRDFMLKENDRDAYYVWIYLEDKYGLVNPIDGHKVNPTKPDELEPVWSSYLETFTKKYGERKTNKHYMDIFDKFVEDHEELKTLLDGHHYLVSLSDHDDDYWDYDIDGEEIEV